MPHLLTLVADRAAISLSSGLIARVRDAVQGGAPVILAEAEAIDIPCPAAPDMAAVRAALDHARVDAIPVRAEGRRKALLVADMDSTIVIGETLDELADFAGLKEPVAAITARAMNGELDFAAALRARVAMLKGLTLAALDATWARVALTPGARALVATMRAHGAETALVSGGFTYFTEKVTALLGFDLQRANVLLHDGSALTGEVAEPIVGRDAKVETLLARAAALGIGPEAAVAVGDGANDLAMLRAAGLGVAFRAKPIVAGEVEARIDYSDLRALLFAQGYTNRDIRDT